MEGAQTDLPMFDLLRTPLKLNRTVKGQCKKCYTRAVRLHEEAHALQAVLDRAKRLETKERQRSWYAQHTARRENDQQRVAEAVQRYRV